MNPGMVTHTLRSVLPDIESLVIVGLGFGTVLFFLDVAGVDVVSFLSSLPNADGVAMVAFAFVSKAVERFREAVDDEPVSSTRP